MEKAHLARILSLRCLRITIKPCDKFLTGIFWKRAMTIHLQHRIHHQFYRFQRQGEISDRSSYRCQPSHDVCISKYAVAKSGAMFAVADACRLYDISYSYIRWACHLTTLAIKAIFQCLIKKLTALQAQPFAIRSRLLRTRIFRTHRHHRAINGTNGALYALLEIVGTDIIFL